MTSEKTSNQSEIIPRLYLKLLPVQIILVIIGGINSIIDNGFAGNLIGPQAMAITGLFSPVIFLLAAVNALIFGGAQVLCGRYLGKKMVERTRSIFSLDIIVMTMISAVLHITVHSMDEVINLSEKVWEFCEKRGISGHRRNCSSLCTEELSSVRS